MPSPLLLLAALRHCLVTVTIVLLDFGRLLAIAVRSRRALAAENLFLRKQLALFQERKVKPRRANDSTRWLMATLSRMFQWRDVLWNVKPDTLIGWHRKGFRLFWRWKSKPTGRPRLPKDLRQLIREMAADNVTWGEERIANELKLKLGIRVSPRTVGKYLRTGGPVRTPDPKQRWLTFVRNHGDCGLRLLCCGHCHVPGPLCVRGHGAGDTQDRTSQRHGPSHSGLDVATVSRGTSGRSYVSISHSRPGQHFLPGTGQTGCCHGSAGVANAGKGSKGEFIVRTFRRNIAPRMSRFPHSVQ